MIKPQNELRGAIEKMHGGIATFAALCAPYDLLLHNHRGTGTGQLPLEAYKSLNAEGKLKRVPERMTPEQVAEWLTPTRP